MTGSRVAWRRLLARVPAGRYLKHMRLTWFVLVVFACSVEAQKPMKSAWLTWPDFKVVIAPDTTGEAQLWLTVDSAMAREPGGRFFFGSLEPRATVDWVKSVRKFLRDDLQARDTGEVRSSRVLRATSGEQLYFVRRRFKGNWTHERFLVFSDSAGRAPALIEMDVRLSAVLDSLEAVARRTPAAQGRGLRPPP